MTKRVLGFLMVALLLLSLVICWRGSGKGAIRQTGAPTEFSEPTAAPLSQRMDSERLTALEARREHLNRSIWATELLAQKHEEVFIKLWDDLRNLEDAFAVLRDFSFGELRLGRLGAPVQIDQGISLQHFEAPVELYPRDSWHRLLDRLKEQGYRLEQSEWRHPRFSISTNGAAESSIYVTLHASNPVNEDRYVLRGDLRVRWRSPREPLGPPFPELIDASQLEVLHRRGQTPFHHVIAANLTPERIDAKQLEPSLQLYDLNGDGLSEIIVAARNRIFWNRGQGVFASDQLLAYPLPAMSAGLLADFDSDGLADFLAADPQGLALFVGDAQGRFPKPAKRIRFASQALANPIVMTAGDIDGDGDLDVWLAQYKVPYQSGQVPTPYYDANDGWPSFLLVNDGRGNFQDQTARAGLAAKRFRRTYSSSFVDLDDDGDLDLVVVSDFAGVDVYFNDGKGRFSDSTSRVLDEAHVFGMAHALGDFDRGGRLDLFVIGMNSFVANRLDALQASAPDFPESTRMRAKMAYGNRLYFWRDGVLKHTALSEQVARSGWSWGVATGDFDNDGDLDIYIANGHISGRSAKDYEPEFWEHDLYLGSSNDDAALDQYFRSVRTRYQGAGLSYGGFEKNRFFLNGAGKSFSEVGYLMGVSLEEDCRNAVSDDLDGDGKLDLLVVTFQTWPKIRQALHLFPNFTDKAGNWIGFHLRESGRGFSPVGAKVSLATSSGKQIHHFVTGDSYRSQRATTAHFGLGSQTEVQSVEVVWPNGQRTKIQHPAINQYHFVKPGQD